MTPQQIIRMYNALRKISKEYQTPQELGRNSAKMYGLDYTESLEMAYENLQAEAKAAIKGIRINAFVKKLKPKNP